MNDNVVDTLRIEVEGDSSKAVSNVEKLVNTLERLKTSSTGSNKGLSALQNRLNSISKIASKIDSSGITKINKIANSLNKLNTVKISSTIANRLVDIGAAIDLLKDVDMSKLTQMADGLGAINSVGNVSLPTNLGTTVTTPASSPSPTPALEGSVQIDSTTVTEATEKLNGFGSVISLIQSKIKGFGRSAVSVFSDMAKSATHGAATISRVIGKAAIQPFVALDNRIKKTNKLLGNFFKMVKRRVMYRAINAVISAVTSAFKEGTANVYQYSKAIGGNLASSLDNISTNFLYFKNSIGAAVAPLINMLAPAIDYVINKCVDLLNILNQVLAKLSGASTWTKAVKYPTEYAKAADKASAANKKLKNSILGIDELNVLQDNSSSGGGSGAGAMDYSSMFEEQQLTKMENPFANFFKPFRDAWETEGINTINSIRQALTNTKTLFTDIGNSFNEVWQNGTGQKTCETILKITQGIFDIWGNLASSIDDAWNNAGTGTRIVQAAWDIFNSILDTIEGITSSTAKWAKKLNFSPLLESVAKLLESIKPLIDGIGKVLQWIWDNVLLPVGKWLIETELPATINAISGLIDFVTGVFTGDWDLAWQGVNEVFDANLQAWEETIAPIAAWLDENVLTPIGQFFSDTWNSVKEKASEAWEGVKEIWGKVTGWFDEKIIQPVGDFFSGLWESISITASECWDSIVEFFSPAITWFSELFGSVKQTLSDIFYNIGVIASGCWEIIKRVWGIVSAWFNEKVIQPVSNFFSTAWNNIKTWASNAWEGIKEVFGKVKDWFNEKVIQPLANFFTPLWNGFKEKAAAAWEGVKTVFSKVGTFFGDIFSKAWQKVVNVFSVAGEIFVKIKDGVVSAFKKIVNGIIGGINSAIAVPFNGINTALTKIKNIEIVGIQPFAGLRTISVPQIPLLAEGGVVNAGQMFIAREAGAELVGSVGRQTAVLNNDQIVESVSQGVADANAEQNALLREQNDLLRKLLDKDFDVTALLDSSSVVNGINRKNRRDGRTIIPVGT